MHMIDAGTQNDCFCFTIPICFFKFESLSWENVLKYNWKHCSFFVVYEKIVNSNPFSHINFTDQTDRGWIFCDFCKIRYVSPRLHPTLGNSHWSTVQRSLSRQKSLRSSEGPKSRANSVLDADGDTESGVDYCGVWGDHLQRFPGIWRSSDAGYVYKYRRWSHWSCRMRRSLGAGWRMNWHRCRPGPTKIRFRPWAKWREESWWMWRRSPMGRSIGRRIIHHGTK